MIYYTKAQLENSPSRRDGISFAREMELRKKYVKFICSVGKELKLSPWAMETACVLTHRFFALRSMDKNDRLLVAIAALFLACKVDESPRNLRDLAYVYMTKKLAGKSEELAKMNANQAVYLQPLMDQMMLAERALLYSLAFELNVEHPFNTIMSAVKKLSLLSHADSQNVSQLALNFVNDSLGTTLLVQYPASKVGLASIYRAAIQAKIKLPLPEGSTFCDFFDIMQAELDDIVSQFMDHYATIKKPAAEEKAAAHGQPLAPHAQPPVPHAQPPAPHAQPPVPHAQPPLQQVHVKPPARLHHMPPPPMFRPPSVPLPLLAESATKGSLSPAAVPSQPLQTSGQAAEPVANGGYGASMEATPPVKQLPAESAAGNKRARSWELEDGEMPECNAAVEKIARADAPTTNSPNSNTEALTPHADGDCGADMGQQLDIQADQTSGAAMAAAELLPAPFVAPSSKQMLVPASVAAGSIVLDSSTCQHQAPGVGHDSVMPSPRQGMTA